jgi:orotate phosphoribosyltransferase-like protein
MAVALPELPPVHGQHRNRALAAARRARAVELRTSGLTYGQIATELGYANRGTVYHVVSEALKAQTAEAVGELRSLEVERLDNVQLAVWQKAMDGDVPSAIAVVRVHHGQVPSAGS